MIRHHLRVWGYDALQVLILVVVVVWVVLHGIQ